MYRSPNSSIFHKQNKGEASFSNTEGVCFSGESFSKYGYQIADLQKKMELFGGMEDVQEDIINELTRSSQRIDLLASKVKKFLKLQPNTKDRKNVSYSSYSHLPMQNLLKQTTTHNTSQVQKPEKKVMRLKDRVQRALQQQDSRSVNLQKQPKYIK